eukprot:TRINITY_DN41421_c0_g1_i1.p1 TRINITY_DN41421_c0_g1~~TRINITY_DN41421_c0_g1_i1.p1  ORF type:complete len:136 (+),score=11.66 TRINITY_DN41421_c0_g1_i1:19-426(+)
MSQKKSLRNNSKMLSNLLVAAKLILEKDMPLFNMIVKDVHKKPNKPYKMLTSVGLDSIFNGLKTQEGSIKTQKAWVDPKESKKEEVEVTLEIAAGENKKETLEDLHHMKESMLQLTLTMKKLLMVLSPGVQEIDN